jgi:hypothetical protein
MDKPVIGMGVTKCIGSDRYPCTVIKVIGEKRCVVQRDRVAGLDAFEQNPEGEKITIYLNSRGKWRKSCDESKSYRFIIGARAYYQDPSF